VTEILSLTIRCKQGHCAGFGNVKRDDEKKGINKGLLFTSSSGSEKVEVSSVEDEDCSSSSEEEREEDSDDSSELPELKRAKDGLE
jgi:hypothetical protein